MPLDLPGSSMGCGVLVSCGSAVSVADGVGSGVAGIISMAGNSSKG